MNQRDIMRIHANLEISLMDRALSRSYAVLQLLITITHGKGF